MILRRCVACGTQFPSNKGFLCPRCRDLQARTTCYVTNQDLDDDAQPWWTCRWCGRKEREQHRAGCASLRFRCAPAPGPDVECARPWHD